MPEDDPLGAVEVPLPDAEPGVEADVTEEVVSVELGAVVSVPDGVSEVVVPFDAVVVELEGDDVSDEAVVVEGVVAAVDEPGAALAPELL